MPASLKDISDVFNVLKSAAYRVVQSRRARRLGHSDEVDMRGMYPQLSNKQAHQISDYIDNCPFEEKNLTWEELQLKARVPMDDNNDHDTYHHDTIQRHVTAVSGIKTYKALVKEELDKEKRDQRITWAKLQLELRPHGPDWKNLIWCDELHWATGPRYAKHIKRRPSERDHPKNIQYNSGGRPKNNEQKGQQQEKKKQHQFHIFTVIGYDFAWCMPYDAGNSNGKMNARTYLKILKELHTVTLGRDLILFQDCDSAHFAKSVLKFCYENGIEILKPPGCSPDLSIMETWVKPLREKFFKIRCSSAELGVQRFYEVFNDLDPEKINRTIEAYPARLHEVLRADGRMTKY